MDSNIMRPMSLSKLNVYKACPKQYYYKHVENRAQRESTAMARGLVIHEALENRVKRAMTEGSVSLKDGDQATAKIQWFLDELAELGFDLVVPEQAIAYDPYTLDIVDWSYKGPVVRAKLDMMFTTPSAPGVLVVIDWKTGQVYDKHTEEREFYAAVCALMAASTGVEFDRVAAAYAYVDQGTVNPFCYLDPASSSSWTREVIFEKLRTWSDIMIAAGTATRFTYTPGQPQCGWCDYSKAKNGPCMF